MKQVNFCIFVLTALLLSSCMTTRTSVQNYKETHGQEYRYSKAKQCYLFWGLIPLGRTTIATPVDKPCQVRTSFRFFDALCSTITGGIFSMQTIKVMAKRSASDQDYFNKGDAVTYKQSGKYAHGTIDSLIDEDRCVVKTESGKLVKMKFENLTK